MVRRLLGSCPVGARFVGAGVLAAFVVAMPVAAEGYEATATTTLGLDRGGVELVQQWTLSCVADDPAADAVLRPGGRDLRFFRSPDEAVAVGVDDTTFPIDATAVGSYRYDVVAGARVFARFTGRCGGAEVADEVVVDSTPLVLAPRLSAPFSVVRTDTLEVVEADAIPRGVEVELSGLTVQARPRGDERVVVALVGGGVDARVELGPDDVDGEGIATLSPRLTATVVEPITVTAELLGVQGEPLTFRVVLPDADGGGDGPGAADPSGGCAAPLAPPAVAPLALLLLRRRRRRRI